MIGQSVINGGLNARKTKYASMTWVTPPATPRSTRIYAVIDPDNAITNEVHENNNIGWTTLSDYSLPVSVSGTGITEVPESIELLQNYPNPFNPSTTIAFSIPSASNTTLKIFDALGREVRTLVNEKLSRGSYKVTFNGSDLSSGVYFYKLQTDNSVKTKKLILIK